SSIKNKKQTRITPSLFSYSFIRTIFDTCRLTNAGRKKEIANTKEKAMIHARSQLESWNACNPELTAVNVKEMIAVIMAAVTAPQRAR
ncbi:hypothetical protein P4686_13930, partial [Terribacillus saccharophilus]|nr:hypothetical protein [Terribacillus saccharophilus]